MPNINKVLWAYGVTTVPQRCNDLLPQTLQSLKLAGFEHPRLFIDGCSPQELIKYQERFGFDITARYPKIRTYGNWVLSLAELYIRNPTATRYAIFQDDFLTYKNLRQYLEKCKYPDNGYWNLYTMRSNQQHILDSRTTHFVGNTGRPKSGWYESNQFGRGAVALIFDRETVMTLLTHQHMVERPLDPQRGHKSVDGGVVTALIKAGWKEYVHYPSLTQHMGLISSMGNKPQKQAASFIGTEFDALDLLKEE